MINIPDSVCELLCRSYVINKLLAYFCVDRDLNIRLMGGATSHYGLSIQSIGKQAYEELYFLEGILPTGDEHVVIPFLQLDNNTPFELQIMKINNEWWGALTDATDSKLRQREIRQTVRELGLSLANQAKALDEIEQLNHRLNEFVHSVAYDFRHQISKTKEHCSNLLEVQAVKEENSLRNSISSIAEQANKLNMLTQGLINYTLPSSKQEVQEVVDLRELLLDIVRNTVVHPGTKIDIQECLPHLRINKTQISQVFQTLLINSIERVDKQENNIKITCDQIDKLWQFSISSCIAEGGSVDKLAQPATVSSEELKENLNSSGVRSLGFSIASRIISSFGGKIWIEKSPKDENSYKFQIPNK